MSKKIYNIIAIIIIAFTTTHSLANYQISPVKLELNKKDKVTSLNFRNAGTEEKSFQVTVLKRDKSKPKKTYKVSKDLIVAPVIFKISPKRGQLIRVALKKASSKSEEHDDYRISIKEVPQGYLKTNGVKFITEMTVPVTIK